MTDESPDPAESPESVAIRHLLGEARHDEPIPDDVAARLDGVLADLAGTRAATAAGDVRGPSVAPDDERSRGIVTRLPLHRRRQAAALLATAAAIVVGGVVLAQHPLGGGTTSGSTASSAEDGRFSAGDSAGGERSPAPAAGGSKGTGAPSGSKAVLRNGQVVVRRESFAADALAARALVASAPPPRLQRVSAPCPAPGRGQQVVAALYAGAPAALVYHRPDGSTQVVDLVVCGSGRPVASVTLPAP